MEWIMALYIPESPVHRECFKCHCTLCCGIYHEGPDSITATTALKRFILQIGQTPTSDFIAIRFISVACTGAKTHTCTHTPTHRRITGINSIRRLLVYSQMVNLPWINLMKTTVQRDSITHTHTHKYLIKPNGNSSTSNFIIWDLPDTPSPGRQVTLSHFMMHGYHLHSRVVTEAFWFETSSDRAES